MENFLGNEKKVAHKQEINNKRVTLNFDFS